MSRRIEGSADVGSWLDTLPPLPLTRGVPVYCPGEPGDGFACRGVFIKHGCISDLAALVVVDEESIGYATQTLRVDLSEPGGVGYALRWLCQNGRPKGGWMPQTAHSDIIRRHMAGGTTDADRVALAKALAEVVS